MIPPLLSLRLTLLCRLPSVAALLTIASGLGSSPASAQQPAAASGYHLEATWKLGGEGGWDYLALDADAHRLYVTRTDRVQVIDTETGKMVGEVPGLDGGHGTALAPEFHCGFATSGRSGKVIVFDLETLKSIGDPIPVGKKPDAIIYEPLTRHVFAFNGESDDVTVIEAATAKVVATIPLGGGPEFAVADGQGMVFVNLEEKGEILALDVHQNTVLHRWPLAPGKSPTGLALDTANHRLFAGCHNELFIVLDATTGKILGTPAIGKGVDAAAFDPGTGFAFASCGEGILTVVKEDSAKPGEYAVVENVPTRPSARTMALDPHTHAVYVAAADFEPVPTPAPGAQRARPKMIPGTFVILKYGR